MKKRVTFVMLLIVGFSHAQTGIGTTSPVNKFQIETAAASPATTGTASNGNLRISATGANQVLDFGLGTTFGWLQARDKTNYATNNILALNPNGGNVGIGTVTPTVRLQVNGDIIANSIAGSSDQRFKINIRTIDNALNKVKSLRGVYFNWNQIAFPERDFGNQNEIGFIAQEVEKISPELVSKDTSPSEYRSVKYDKVVALLVEAIKEQQIQIEQLKIEVKKLKRKKDKRMKTRFFLIFVFLYSFLSSQGITAPNSLNIEANRTNVDAGDFVISWPNNTEDLLVSLSLDYHNGATLSFPITTGITRAYGFNSWNSVTSIVFYGKRDNLNSALAAMTLSMGSIKTAVRINLEVSSYDPGYTYNPVNKHFYRYISGLVSYATAKANAGTYYFKGKTGYLATITSQSEQDFLNNNIVGNNIWFALTDVASEGNWRIDAGPEAGTLIKTQNGQTAGNIAGFYNNWCSGEPNDASNEDYAVTKWNGGTCWNDVNGTNSSVAGYIVEISDDFPAGSGYTDVYNSFVVHNNDVSYTLQSGNSTQKTSWSNPSNMMNGIIINPGHTITVPVNNTIYSNKITLLDTGKMVFTNSTSKWTTPPVLKSCKEILQNFPLAESGIYNIDPDGAGALPSTSCYCDMTTDGGGWTLVLNYLHKGGTNPALSFRTNNLPLLGSTTLGVDEQGSTISWGHTTPSYLNAFTFTELRFFGITSGHGRVMHFKTSHANTLNYFKSGSGSMTGINTSFTALSGHTAYLPNSAANYFINEGNSAMTNFPFWLNSTYHWGIQGHGFRWEVDDFPGDSRNNTFHQIWIR